VRATANRLVLGIRHVGQGPGSGGAVSSRIGSLTAPQNAGASSSNARLPVDRAVVLTQDIVSAYRDGVER